jgi:hypothetical protein
MNLMLTNSFGSELSVSIRCPFEVVKGLADRAHVRDERLVVIDQNKEQAECCDVGGCKV